MVILQTPLQNTQRRAARHDQPRGSAVGHVPNPFASPDSNAYERASWGPVRVETAERFGFASSSASNAAGRRRATRAGADKRQPRFGGGWERRARRARRRVRGVRSDARFVRFARVRGYVRREGWRLGVFSFSASHRGRRGRRGFPLRGVALGDVGVARASRRRGGRSPGGSRGPRTRGVPRHLAGPRVAVVRPGERGSGKTRAEGIGEDARGGDRGRRERRGSGKTFGDDSTRRAPLLRVGKSENGASGGNRARTFRSPGRGCASSRLRAVSPSPRAARGKRSRRSSRRRRNAARRTSASSAVPEGAPPFVAVAAPGSSMFRACGFPLENVADDTSGRPPRGASNRRRPSARVVDSGVMCSVVGRRVVLTAQGKIVLVHTGCCDVQYNHG